LNTREQFWIDYLNVLDVNIGYNICPIAGIQSPQNGSNNTMALINEETAINIKHDLSNGCSIKELENKYSVSNSIIVNIRNLKSWKEYVPELNEKIFSFVKARLSKIDINTATLIKVDLSNGIDIKDLQSKYNVTYNSIVAIRNLTTYRECVFELNGKITRLRNSGVDRNKTLKMIKMRSYCEKCGKIIYKTNNKQKFCKKCAQG